MKKKMILCASVLLLMGSTVFIQKLKTETNIVKFCISEVVTANGSYEDSKGEYSDWIEILYEGKEAVNLSEYYLSDDPDKIFRWNFPDREICPGEYLVIFASGKDQVTAEGEIHTNFKLDCMGETLYLSDSEGKLMTSLTIPELPFDASYGKTEKGYQVFSQGSPMELNTQQQAVCVRDTEAVSYSVPAGVYAEEIYLELATRESEAEIFYTLDGSIPTETSLKYEGDYLTIADRTMEENQYTAIWTSPYDWETEDGFSYNPNPQYKATVVKTRLYFPKENVWSKEIWTNTYLIGADYSLPIVSLSAEEADLFDEATGICVPGDAYWEYLETAEVIDQDPRKRVGNYSSNRKVSGYLEYFSKSGSKVMENQMTMRICGNISRGSGMKSFAVYAWGDETKGVFSYPIFQESCKNIENNEITEFTSLRLRNFGNDWRRSKFRDALGQKVLEGLDLGTQAYEPAVLLVNGEYYGLCEIRENRDGRYFEEHFGIAEEELLEVKIADLGDGDRTEAESEFLELISYMETHDLSVKEHYEYVEQRLNVERFMDYVLAQLYLQNIDWLYNNCNFIKSTVVREDSAYADGRWQVFLYDLDYSMNYENVDNYTTFYESGCFSAKIIKALLANEACKAYYMNRFEELMEIYFEPSKGIALLEEFQKELEAEVAEDFSRWDLYQNGTLVKATGIDYWYEKMDDIRRFFEERPQYAKEYFYQSLNSEICKK